MAAEGKIRVQFDAQGDKALIDAIKKLMNYSTEYTK